MANTKGAFITGTRSIPTRENYCKISHLGSLFLHLWYVQNKLGKQKKHSMVDKGSPNAIVSLPVCEM